MAEDRRRPPKFSTETRKSDPRRTNDENFASFMGFLDERFYDVDRHACRVKKGVRSYTYSLHLVRCGVARLAAFETDAMTLRYSIRKNRYHSFIKLMMPTSGTFTITVNGVRTVRLAPGEALLFDPTEDITYAAVKDTKGISLLVASNYFHARTRFQAALFKVLPILGKTARERCFLAVLRAVHDYLGDMTPEEAEDYCDTLSAALRPVLSESFSGNDKSFASHQDFLRACAVDAMYKHIADPEIRSDDIAREVGVSSRYLSDLFRKTGSSVMNRLLALRLERASTQLRDAASRAFTIEEIAKNNGFASLTHFGRVFKKTYGATPSEWRNAETVDTSFSKDRKDGEA